MAVPYTFATIPNGQTIPLQYLDANFAYIETQIGSIGGGVLTISGGSTGLLPNVPTAGNVILSGTLNISNGGTGATNAADAINALLPTQTGQNGKYLITNGTTASWAPGVSGGVTSFSAGTTGFTPSSASTGAISLTGVLNIAHGGTGATTASAAAANLLPSQTGNVGFVLSTNGAGTLSWVPAGGAATLTVGASPIAAGTSGYILYDNAGTLDELATTGTGNVVLDTASTITTPTINQGTQNQPLTVGAREQEVGLTIAAGVLTVDCDTGTVFAFTLNANITAISFVNVPVLNNAYSMTLSVTADGTPRTITWPGSVKWPNSIAPTLTSTNGKVDTFVLYTYDAGVTWYAFVAGQNA